MRAGAQVIGELLDRRGRDDAVVAAPASGSAGEFPTVRYARKVFIARNAVSARPPSASDAKRGVFLQIAALRRTVRIAGQGLLMKESVPVR